MSFSPNSVAAAPCRIASLVLCAILLGLLAGCIADTAEDTDLPWARNQGWEGVIPLPLSTEGSAYD